MAILPTSFSPPISFCLSVLFLCKAYTPSVPSLLCYLTLSLYLNGFHVHHQGFCPHIFISQLFYAESTLDQGELVCSRRACHACMLYSLGSCIFENVGLLHLYLNGILMGCNVGVTSSPGNFADITPLSSSIEHCSGKSDFSPF